MVQNPAKEFYKILETISGHAKTGLAFSKHPYDLYRYQQILHALDNMQMLLAKEGILSSIFSFLREIPTDIGNQEYVTPKIAVAVAAFDNDDRILLVKRLDGLWALPGGYADIPLDPIENAEKEVKEETGLDIAISSLIGIFDSNINKFPSIGRQVYLLVFLGNVLGGTLIANPDETNGVDLFSLDSLPELLPTTVAQIQYGFRMRKGEVLPSIVEHNTTQEGNSL